MFQRKFFNTSLTSESYVLTEVSTLNIYIVFIQHTEVDIISMNLIHTALFVFHNRHLTVVAVTRPSHPFLSARLHRLRLGDAPLNTIVIPEITRWKVKASSPLDYNQEFQKGRSSQGYGKPENAQTVTGIQSDARSLPTIYANRI